MKKLSGAKIPGLKHTWSEVERRTIKGECYRLIECDNPDVMRLKVIDSSLSVVVRDADDDALGQLEASILRAEHNPIGMEDYGWCPE